jgi:nucleoside-diphosphate kinase
MQRTLVLLKPDCVHRRLVGALLQRFEQKGLRFAAMKIVQPRTELAEKHYAVHRDKPFYPSLIAFLTSGPSIALVLEGREAIAVVRNMMGPTDGAKAPPGTIRGDFALSVQNNLIHGSDSPETAADEIALWFRPEELVSYQIVDTFQAFLYESKAEADEGDKSQPVKVPSSTQDGAPASSALAPSGDMPVAVKGKGRKAKGG